MQQLDTSSVWQVTNQEQTAVNQGEKGKTDYKIPKKLMWLSLMGLTLSDQKLKQKAKLIFIVNSPSVLVTWNGCFANLFFLEKIFWITKKQYFKGIKSILTWWDRPLSQVIRKRTLKNVDIYITWHKALFYRHVQFELLYCTVKVMAYVIIFPQEQKEILTFQHVKYAITKQVGRNCIQFLQPHFHELAFQAP